MTTAQWLVFVLPPVVAVIGGALLAYFVGREPRHSAPGE